jgi:putative transposase
MSKYQDGHTYHIFNRGAHQFTIFRRTRHYRKCIELLLKYSAHYDVSLVAYCLMPNHYHLIATQQKSGSISRFLQTTFNSFVQYYNVSESHSGTLFQGAAKSTWIDTDDYLLRSLRYVHMNPVSAKLVKKASEWEFSDCRVWVGYSDVAFPGRTIRDQFFKDGKGYLEFLEAGEPDTSSSDLGLILDP